MKNLIFKTLRFTGLHLLFRRFIQKKKVTILAFHNISPACAEEAIIYLKAHYTIIPLRRYIRAVQTKDPGLLPPYALVITLDRRQKT